MSKKLLHNQKGMHINDKPLDFDNPEFWQYLQDQKKLAEADRNRSIQNVNETERTLCAQIMLYTTVLLTGNVLFLGDSDITSMLTTAQSIMIVLGLILIVLSAIFGTIYFFKIMDFFKQWARVSDKAADVYNSREFNTWNEATTKLDKINSLAPTENKKSFLVAQLACICLATITYIGLVVAYLFDLRFINTLFN